MKTEPDGLVGSLKTRPAYPEQNSLPKERSLGSLRTQGSPLASLKPLAESSRGSQGVGVLQAAGEQFNI